MRHLTACRHDCCARLHRTGPITNTTLVPASKQRLNRDEKEISKQKATPAEWKPAPCRQKDRDATWTKKHGKSHFGYRLSTPVDQRYKVILKLDRYRFDP